MPKNKNIPSSGTEPEKAEEFYEGAEFGEFPETDEADNDPEREHDTYVRIKTEYLKMLARRGYVNRSGIIFIGASAVAFLALMFSLESKLIFLVLWIAVIIVAVSYLIHNEYKIYKLRLYLGYETEESDNGSETDENDAESADENTSQAEESEENDE